MWHFQWSQHIAFYQVERSGLQFYWWYPRNCEYFLSIMEEERNLSCCWFLFYFNMRREIPGYSAFRVTVPPFFMINYSWILWYNLRCMNSVSSGFYLQNLWQYFHIRSFFEIFLGTMYWFLLELLHTTCLSWKVMLNNIISGLGDCNSILNEFNGFYFKIM